MYHHLLVPTDGSELSNQTVTSAVAYAKEMCAKITFFYAAPDYLATGDGALIRSVSPLFAAEKIAEDAHAILLKAETAAQAANVACTSLYKISDRPHEVIVETAGDCGCDLIFIASRGPRSIGGLMLGSETLKVLMHSPIPVLVSSVARNSANPKMDIAIGIIQDEHRSLGAVLHGLKHAIELASERNEPPDFELLRLMLYYIREFPEKMHHPKEDSYLFSLLRQRTDVVNDTIAILERDHGNHANFDMFEAELLRFESAGISGAPCFAKALKEYSEHQWQHMRTEESVILPAAKKYLLPEDWIVIGEAFGKNGDPRFNKAASADLFAMFKRLAKITYQAARP